MRSEGKLTYLQLMFVPDGGVGAVPYRLQLVPVKRVGGGEKLKTPEYCAGRMLVARCFNVYGRVVFAHAEVESGAPDEIKLEVDVKRGYAAVRAARRPAGCVFRLLRNNEVSYEGSRPYVDLRGAGARDRYDGLLCAELLLPCGRAIRSDEVYVPWRGPLRPSRAAASVWPHARRALPQREL